MRIPRQGKRLMFVLCEVKNTAKANALSASSETKKAGVIG